MTKKYADLYSVIRGLLQSIPLGGIKIFPVGWSEDAVGDEFLQFSIISSGQGINRVSVTGVIQIVITTATDDVEKRSAEIATILDDALVGASKDGVQCARGSSLSPYKERTFLYTLPFSHYRSN